MSRGPIPDNIMAYIRHCVKTQHAESHQALAWQRALDHRRWLLDEVDRLQSELDSARNEIDFLAARCAEH